MSTLAPVLPPPVEETSRSFDSDVIAVAETLAAFGYPPSFARCQPEWDEPFRNAVAGEMETFARPPS